jgi:hypothetical protein
VDGSAGRTGKTGNPSENAGIKSLFLPSQLFITVHNPNLPGKTKKKCQEV